MNNAVITVENLGKMYKIGETIRHDTFRDAFTHFFSKNFQRKSSAQKSNDETIWALKNVSFEVKRGEVIGIIGRNGAGKSTLLKILSRITEPTEGRAEIRGRLGSLLEVGTGFHPELTGRENIYLNGAILGLRKREIQNKFDEIVAFSEIEKFIDTPVKRYSSGMYVRLAFAVAAHLETEILLIDEVLAVGDAAFQKKCLGKMGDVAKEGRTVLFISHNMAAVISLCQKGIVLVQGHADFIGNIQEAISRYISQNSASSVGHTDLSKRTVERYGPKKYAYLESISLLDDKNNPVKVLEMGKLARFRLEIDFKRIGEDFEIGISIGNLYNVSLHYLISNWEGFQVISQSGTRIIEVEIPSIVLFPGEYQVAVWVKRQGELYDDAVHEAITFSVIESQITPHYAYFQRYSLNSQVYVPSKWRLIK